jgi:phosphohistidine phosphatase
MHRLILMRHGQAEARGEGDFARRLTVAGARAAAETAHALADTGVAPQVVLVSGAQRTRETWMAAEAAFPGAKPQFDDRLYNASAEQMIEAAEAADAATVMIVGHNPGAHELAVRLMARDPKPPAIAARLLSGFPPAAIVVFRFDGERATAIEAVLLPDAAA